MKLTQETFEMMILAAPFAVIALAALTLLLLLFRKWSASCLKARWDAENLGF